jgi:hypothetical protein
MQILKPFSKVEDISKQREASEASPIDIPFQHPDYLLPQYSNGKTDRCFFLRAKKTNEIFPWNSSMAEFGNIFYMPHFDMELLRSPDFESSVRVWMTQGVLPADFLGNPKAVAKKQESAAVLIPVAPVVERELEEETTTVAPAASVAPKRNKIRDLASAFGETNDTATVVN